MACRAAVWCTSGWLAGCASDGCDGLQASRAYPLCYAVCFWLSDWLWFAGEVRLPYVSEENHDEDPEMQARPSCLPACLPARRMLCVLPAYLPAAGVPAACQVCSCFLQCRSFMLQLPPVLCPSQRVPCPQTDSAGAHVCLALPTPACIACRWPPAQRGRQPRS
jgi:hypothetical protein